MELTEARALLYPEPVAQRTDHVSSDWRNRQPDTHVGSTHVGAAISVVMRQDEPIDRGGTDG